MHDEKSLLAGPHDAPPGEEPLRVLSVCSSVGGLDLGLHRAGLETVGLCEFEPWRRQVLRRHWGKEPHIWDDLLALADEAEADPQAVIEKCGGRVDVLVGGTPCQDLSAAGKRAGLDGERSGLFWAFCRLRLALGVRWTLWENVAGAFTSNRGMDFAQVLGAFVGAAVAVPTGGWGGAGVATGPWGGCCWRRLDAQHFGVPQRRRRVFVVGRIGAECPPEILIDPPRGGRDHAAGDEARPAAPWASAGRAGAVGRAAVCGGAAGGDGGGDRGAAGEAGGAAGDGVPGGDDGGPGGDGHPGRGAGPDLAPTITTRYGAAAGNDMQQPGAIVAPALTRSLGYGGLGHSGKDDAALAASGALLGRGDRLPPAREDGQSAGRRERADADEIGGAERERAAGAEAADADGVRAADGVAGRVDGHEVTAHTERAPHNGSDVSPALMGSTGRDGGGQKSFVMVGSDAATHSLTAEGHDASEDGTGRGAPIVGTFVKKRGGTSAPDDADTWAASDVARTVTEHDAHRQDSSPALAFTQLSNGGADEDLSPTVTGGGGNTMPHTLTADDPEWFDPHMDPKPDGRRYAACGDGVAAPVAHWIGLRLAAVDRGEDPDG